MADNFNTPEGQTIGTELLVTCLNVGTKEAPEWAPIGYRVTSSEASLDWQKEDFQDILGNGYSTMKKPIITQPFSPWPLSNGDKAQFAIWRDGIKNQDAQAMANKDMLRIHKYYGETDAVYAERYESCAIIIDAFGGDGGAHLNMPITVTYGGARTEGTVKTVGSVITFTPDSTGL